MIEVDKAAAEEVSTRVAKEEAEAACGWLCSSGAVQHKQIIDIINYLTGISITREFIIILAQAL